MAKIIVIEDESYILENIVELIRLEQHEVTGTDRGDEGLRLIREHKPDLVLLDILMPEINGYEVLEQIREDAAIQHIPVIVISAYADKDSIQKAMKAGANDYLVKPFDDDRLFDAIAAVL